LQPQASGLRQVYLAKGARVFYSYLLSIIIPTYLLAAGFSGFDVGLALVAILAGNVLSNLLVTYLEHRLGKRRLLQMFSVLMAVSGVLLAVQDSLGIILVSCFLGNISTTGTEAGPFQSIEAGILPELSSGSAAEVFGRYNLVGYAAASVGAFSAGAPNYLPGGILVFRGLFAGFAVLGVLLFLLYSSLRGGIFSEPAATPGIKALGDVARSDLAKLSALFSVDAFGGSFVSVYVLSAYFILTYKVSPWWIFFATSIVVTISIYGASRIAQKIGNLRTMVSTHLVSNVFLVLIPLAGSLTVALAFLFLRQSFSQMDVPTRQALMAEMFQKEERVTAFAVSNTARNVSAFAGGPVNTLFLSMGLLSSILFVGGLSKMGYDLAIYTTYRKRFA
jgi:predicted MFS family arabinose efflux permease